MFCYVFSVAFVALNVQLTSDWHTRSFRCKV